MKYVKERTWDRVLIAGTVLVVFAVLLSAVLGVRTLVEAARVDARARVVRDMATTTQALLTGLSRTWARERDSLRVLVAQRDTVLVTRVARVRTVDTLTLTDTIVVRDALTQCAALAQTCDAFRATATAALAVADSQHVADSVRIVATATRGAVLVTAVTDSLRVAERRISRRPTWKAMVASVATAVSVGFLGGAFR